MTVCNHKFKSKHTNTILKYTNPCTCMISMHWYTQQKSLPKMSTFCVSQNQPWTRGTFGYDVFWERHRLRLLASVDFDQLLIYYTRRPSAWWRNLQLHHFRPIKEQEQLRKLVPTDCSTGTPSPRHHRLRHCAPEKVQLRHTVTVLCG